MDFFKVGLDAARDLQIIINKWVLIAVVVGLLVWIFFWIRRVAFFSGGNFEINETELGIGNQKIKIKPSYEDIQIAYKLWVELSTRKIGLPIDFEHDVISEVFDSWYEFFQLTRELIKSIPVSRARRQESTRKIIKLSIDVLNEGIRPHLTRWQARYRRWYDIESAKDPNKELPPQDIQKKYPQFQELVTEMKVVNGNLIKYREELRKLAFGS